MKKSGATAPTSSTGGEGGGAGCCAAAPAARTVRLPINASCRMGHPGEDRENISIPRAASTPVPAGELRVHHQRIADDLGSQRCTCSPPESSKPTASANGFVGVGLKGLVTSITILPASCFGSTTLIPLSVPSTDVHTPRPPPSPA